VLSNCGYSLKNGIVRPKKIATVWSTKGNHFCVRHPTIVAGNLQYLSKWRLFWRSPIWFPTPQTPMVWIRHWTIQ